MLRRLGSNDQGFKSVVFQPGLNILVADKTQTSADTDSRNGSGKSSLIEILHFQLGMTRLTGSVLANRSLQDTRFVLELDWPGRDQPVTAWRSLKKRSRVDLSPDVATKDVLLTTAGQRTIPEWVEVLGRDLFGLPEQHKSLSARTLLGLYIRRVSQHAFNHPVKTFPTQAVAEASANVAYLLASIFHASGDGRRYGCRSSARVDSVIGV